MDATYTIRKRIPTNITPNKIVGFYLKDTGPISTNKPSDVIAASLKNIIETPTGGCFGLPKFGNQLRDVIFSPLSTLGPDTLETIRAYLQQAITTNYPLPVQIILNPQASYIDPKQGKVVACIVFSFNSGAGIESGVFEAAITL